MAGGTVRESAMRLVWRRGASALGLAATARATRTPVSAESIQWLTLVYTLATASNDAARTALSSARGRPGGGSSSAASRRMLAAL